MGIDIKQIILDVGPALGYLAIFAVIFAESGLFIGFFLPGDSLLFTAGFLASPAIAATTHLSLPILMAVCFAAAVLGDNVGYTFGRRVGPRLFQREDSLLFHKKNIIKAQQFYEKNGPKTIVLARFTPIVRTFAPIVAGIGQMKYRTFVTYNLIGAFLWAIGLNLAGYLLGQVIPESTVDKILLPIVVLIIFVSLLPSILHVLRDEEMRTGLASTARRLITRRTPEAPSRPD